MHPGNNSKNHSATESMNLEKLFQKAKDSSLQRWILNKGLSAKIPFNSPHKFSIDSVTDDGLNISLPYIRRNQNHIGGIHACALATLCEYITGLCISRKFSPDEYRIILKEIRMTYHYQAKIKVVSSFGLNQSVITEMLAELKSADAIFRSFEVEIYDEEKNHICTGNIQWQIKSKNKVNTKY